MPFSITSSSLWLATFIIAIAFSNEALPLASLLSLKNISDAAITELKEGYEKWKQLFLSVDHISQYLRNYFSVDEVEANSIANSSSTNLHRAISLFLSKENTKEYLSLFIKWMRLCYTRNISDTIDWVSDFSKMGRETNKDFLIYSLDNR